MPSVAEVPTPDELRDLLALLLASSPGGSQTTWHARVGPVTKLPLHENVASNWAIAPNGKPADLEAIGEAVEVVRGAHPYVAG